MKLTPLLLTVLAFLVKTTLVYSQQPSPGEKIAFPSPQAASLGKFGGYSLNHSTGAPDVSIPLYTAKEGSFQLPISLTYYYPGFRPSDEPGWVGRGWALNAGGVITRTIKGLRDEFSNRGYLSKGAAVKSIVDDAAPDYNKQVTLNPFDGANDAQPDIFSFQFGNYSGKFVFDESGNPRLLSDKKISITYQISPNDTYHNQGVSIITKWTLVTEDGTRYIFNNYEFSGGNTSDNAWDTSAWHLSEVVNINGDRITFEYTQPNVTKRRVQLGRMDQLTYNMGPTIQESSSSVINTTNFSEEIYLTKINGSLWELVFNSTEYSEVLSSGNTSYGRKLNSLQVFNTASGYQKVNEFTFAYNSAIQLVSVQEAGKPPYQLEYYGSIPVSLDGYTTAVDYWGYYNGQTNGTLIPAMGSDLEPRLETTIVGTLYKVTYPTRGYTLLEYEQNDYSYTQSALVSRPKIVVETNSYWWLTTNGSTLRGSNPSLTLTGPTRVDIKLMAGSSSPPSALTAIRIKPLR